MEALPATLFIIAVILAVIGVAIGLSVLMRLPAPPVTLRRIRGTEEQWDADTPAGGAVVTRVLHPDKGECYEIEAYFRGMRDPELHYVAPSLRVVVDRLTALADAHNAARRVAR